MGRVGGFTLVELVMVIVLLAVLSIGTVQFISQSSVGFASTASRTELATTGRLAIERIAMELRDALPNSIRVLGGQCLEFIPVTAGSRYLTLPVATPSVAFDSLPLTPPAPNGLRVAVYPDVPANVYTLSSPGVLSPVATFAAPDVNNVVQVSLAAAHQFPNESPRARYFVVRDPVSLCVDGDRLWRYQGYGIQAAQPNIGTLPAALPGRALIAEHIGGGTVPFTFNAATLIRNATLVVDLAFDDAGDSIRIHHVVQLRNVP